MNDITIFNHPGNNIRVMTDNQGETTLRPQRHFQRSQPPR